MTKLTVVDKEGIHI